MSIVFLVDENPNVASAGLGDSVCVLHSPRKRNHADNTHGLRRSTDRVAFVYRYESHQHAAVGLNLVLQANESEMSC